MKSTVLFSQVKLEDVFLPIWFRKQLRNFKKSSNLAYLYSIFGRFQVVLGKSDFSGIPDSFLIYVVRPPWEFKTEKWETRQQLVFRAFWADRYIFCSIYCSLCSTGHSISVTTKRSAQQLDRGFSALVTNFFGNCNGKTPSNAFTGIHYEC